MSGPSKTTSNTSNGVTNPVEDQKMEVDVTDGGVCCVPICEDERHCNGQKKHHRKSITKIVAEKIKDAVHPSSSPSDGAASLEPHILMVTKQEVGGIEDETKPLSEAILNKQLHIVDLTKADNAVYATFLKGHFCYDILPTSSKLVVCDNKLSVKKAFFAIVYNNTRAAIVWNSVKQEFDNMLTVSDFIFILLQYYQSPYLEMSEIENHTIESWKEQMDVAPKSRIFCTQNTNSLDAVRMLVDHRIHRLLVVHSETGDPLHILSHKRALKFLYIHLHELPEPTFMCQTIAELGLGTYTNLITVTPQTPLLQALTLLMNHRVSALPVLNADNKCINLYAKFDAVNLAAEKSYHNLDISVEQALAFKRRNIRTCCQDDTLKAVIEKFAVSDVHRLIICRKEDETFSGIISLSDLLVFLLIKQM